MLKTTAKNDKFPGRDCRQDQEKEEQEDGRLLFYVNNEGFPITTKVWDRMWNHVQKIHPDGREVVDNIRTSKDLPKISVPQAPTFQMNSSVCYRLETVQEYLNNLQYNHTGTQFFEIRKNRPLTGLMDTAKEMIRESLPIKCLEAVILGLYLTNGAPGLERFPISFKTQFNGNSHRHVVLGVYHTGRYGALGLSRRNNLMYKPLEYKTLSELAFDFEDAYKQYWHTVQKIKFGLPVSHDPHSFEQIQWKSISLSMSKMVKSDVQKQIEDFAKDMKNRMKWSSLCPYQHQKDVYGTKLNQPAIPKKEKPPRVTCKGSTIANVSSPSTVTAKPPAVIVNSDAKKGESATNKSQLTKKDESATIKSRFTKTSESATIKSQITNYAIRV